MTRVNEYGQPIGSPVPGWTARSAPSGVVLQGTFCRVEPLDPQRHAAQLYAAYRVADDGRDWTYMPVGPFEDLYGYRRYAETAAASIDPRHYTVIDRDTDKAVGTMSLMRHDPTNGVIEVGNVMFSRLLQRTPASTEAQYLLMAYAFDGLGYRRYEWKCDSLNAPSRRTAVRLGFQFEGVFRQAVLYKGRNRDTAWYSVVDADWPTVNRAFTAWLSPDNFTGQGRQRESLSEMRERSRRP